MTAARAVKVLEVDAVSRDPTTTTVPFLRCLRQFHVRRPNLILQSATLPVPAKPALPQHRSPCSQREWMRLANPRNVHPHLLEGKTPPRRSIHREYLANTSRFRRRITPGTAQIAAGIMIHRRQFLWIIWTKKGTRGNSYGYGRFLSSSCSSCAYSLLLLS